MQLKQLLKDKDAVSPVIGVILMVAITVILAAVIGTFVLGLGENVQQTSPQASFSFEYSNSTSGDTLTITHAGGDTIKAANVQFSSTGAKKTNYAGSGLSDVSLKSGSSTWKGVDGSGGDVSSGMSVSLDGTNFDGSNNLKLDLATVRVSWQSTSGDSSATLGKWDGPNA
jgi:flagellin-like protein